MPQLKSWSWLLDIKFNSAVTAQSQQISEIWKIAWMRGNPKLPYLIERFFDVNVSFKSKHIQHWYIRVERIQFKKFCRWPTYDITSCHNQDFWSLWRYWWEGLLLYHVIGFLLISLILFLHFTLSFEEGFSRSATTTIAPLLWKPAIRYKFRKTELRSKS